MNVKGPGQPCRWNEQATAFGLHALEPDEDTALRDHLAGCPSCEEAVAATELIAVALAETVEQVDPPPRLRQTILDRAAKTPQVGSSASSAAAPDAVATGRNREEAHDGEARAGGSRVGRGADARADRGERRTVAAPRGGTGRDTTGPGRRRRRRVVAAFALVAVLAVVGVGGLATYTVRLQQQRDAQIAQTQTLAAQTQALVEVLTQLDRPGTSHATLATSEGGPVAAVVTTTSQRMVMAAGLPANDHTANVYVLWGVSTDSAPQPIGTFDVDPAEPGPLVRQLPLPDPGPGSFLGYAISLEPGRVAPPVPGTVVASGQV